MKSARKPGNPKRAAARRALFITECKRLQQSPISSNQTRERRRPAPAPLRRILILTPLILALTTTTQADTGYDLWLRYAPISDESQRAACRRKLTSLVVEGHSPTADATRAELERGLGGLLGATVSA